MEGRLFRVKFKLAALRHLRIIVAFEPQYLGLSRFRRCMRLDRIVRQHFRVEVAMTSRRLPGAAAVRYGPS
jgi:hypothetical protein